MTTGAGLTREERDILEDYENGAFESVDESNLREQLASAARDTLRKDKRVNIRISEKDLALLRERASIEGIPYQTLMASVLHKFVNGRLKEGGSDFNRDT